MLIRVSHYTFSVSSPYQAGQVMTQAEAQVLNSARAESLRDSIGKKIRDLGGKGLLSAEQLYQLQLQLDELDSKFVLAPRASNRQDGSLQQEIRRVAEEQVWGDAKAGTLSPEALAGRILDAAKDPKVQAEARARLAERLRIVQAGVEDLLG